MKGLQAWLALFGFTAQHFKRLGFLKDLTVSSVRDPNTADYEWIPFTVFFIEVSRVSLQSFLEGMLKLKGWMLPK